MNVNKIKQITLYVHNLNYDGMFILNTLTLNKFFFEAFMEKSSIYTITILYNDMKIIFKCSYKILPSSLKKIAESFKLKKKLPFPYKLINEKNIFNKKEEIFKNSFNSEKEYYEFFNVNNKKKTINIKKYTIKYCSRDVEITLNFIKVLQNIIKDLKINLYKEFSAPSLALKIFINKFNKDKIAFMGNKLLTNYLRPHYYGGRCEVYGNPYEDEYIFHFDFPGMYGLCMSEKFPFGKWEINNNVSNIEKPGFYFIEYSSNLNIPILPFHHPITGKLLFLNGENMRGGFYFEEILCFLKYGGKVNKIIYSITYENYDYVFDEYVNFFNVFREKGSEYKTFAKLMINSLYGRMGMEDKKTHTLFGDKDKVTFLSRKGDLISLKEINDMYLIEVELDHNVEKKMKLKRKIIKSNIALAAAITSKARIKLYEAQQDVLKNKGRLLYSDTDSIYAAYKENVIGKKHGVIFWDPTKEDTEIKNAFFINPKSYGIIKKNNEELIKIKGLNQKNITFDFLKNKFYKNETLIIENFKFLEKKDLILKSITSEKRYDLSLYDKRKFSKDKKNTKAFLIQEILSL